MDYSRFKGLDWFDKLSDLYCVIGGCGGIGSWLTLLATRAGLHTCVYDFDKIESHNLGGQLLSKINMGMPKVDDIAITVKRYCDIDISTINKKFDISDGYVETVTFSAFDNMEARKMMFTKFKNVIGQLKNYLSEPIFIDGRLGAEYFEVYCVTEDRFEEYEKTLFDDSAVADAPCTAKQTSHVASMIASVMVGFCTNHISNIVTKSKDKCVPFKYTFHLPSCFTEIIM